MIILGENSECPWKQPTPALTRRESCLSLWGISFLSLICWSVSLCEWKWSKNKEVHCKKKENQEMTSLKRRDYHVGLVEIMWRQTGVSRKTRPRGKLFMSLNFRMLLCWPFAHFQSSSTEMGWIDHIPPIALVSFARPLETLLLMLQLCHFRQKSGSDCCNFSKNNRLKALVYLISEPT